MSMMKHIFLLLMLALLSACMPPDMVRSTDVSNIAENLGKANNLLGQQTQAVNPPGDDMKTNTPTETAPVATTPSPPSTKAPPPLQSGNPEIPKTDYLPLLDVKRKDNGGNSGNIAGTYIRLHAEGEVTSESPIIMVKKNGTTFLECKDSQKIACRSYADEHRNPLRQFLFGYSLSRVVTIKVSVNNPDFSTTSTLASASYQSIDNKGESWNTEVNGKLYLTPYFRVDSNTTAKIEGNLSATASRKDQVSGNVLSVLQSAATLMAPASPLLTPLSAMDINKTSQFVQQTLSGIFSNSLVEKSTVEVAPRNFNEDEFVTVAGRFPAGQNVHGRKMHYIGEWTIKADPPVVSIFSPATACGDGSCGNISKEDLDKKAFEALSSVSHTHILSFPLTSQTSLKDKLLTDPSVAMAFDALKKATGQEEPDSARLLCNAIDQASYGLGFNRYDSAAIVQAFASMVSMAERKSKALKTALCDAVDLAKRIKLS